MRASCVDDTDALYQLLDACKEQGHTRRELTIRQSSLRMMRRVSEGTDVVRGRSEWSSRRPWRSITMLRMGSGRDASAMVPKLLRPSGDGGGTERLGRKASMIEHGD